VVTQFTQVMVFVMSCLAIKKFESSVLFEAGMATRVSTRGFSIKFERDEDKFIGLIVNYGSLPYNKWLSLYSLIWYWEI